MILKKTTQDREGLDLAIYETMPLSLDALVDQATRQMV